MGVTRVTQAATLQQQCWAMFETVDRTSQQTVTGALQGCQGWTLMTACGTCLVALLLSCCYALIYRPTHLVARLSRSSVTLMSCPAELGCSCSAAAVTKQAVPQILCHSSSG
jgi:hypothetical protein